jgi:hypothetical protein
MKEESPMSNAGNVALEVMDALAEAEEKLAEAARALAKIDDYDPADNETARRLRRLREDVGELRERVEDVGCE